MFFHLGRISTRYRWLIVGLWMVFFAIALPFAPRATQVLHAGGFVSPDFESERAITLLAQKLHFDPTIVQVIFTSRRYSADSPAFQQEAQQALTRVRSWLEVSGVISFTDNPRQISFDRHAAYVNVLLKPDPDTALTLGGGGWDWFSIQLNNDTEMMLYLIRDDSGKTISSYVEYVGRQGNVHLLPPGALRVDVLDLGKVQRLP